ncbi:hypothetical protein KFE25_008585 [Diacronema lutheri]|uniref:Uncharacterized protein n=2 Tax=Diacronema lutheri TaxID=2081491 RepID=A0A8J5Y2Q7_DIALT|nr:hypothetical protein KFE25_008585 [Diacronema lutheri]
MNAGKHTRLSRRRFASRAGVALFVGATLRIACAAPPDAQRPAHSRALKPAGGVLVAQEGTAHGGGAPPVEQLIARIGARIGALAQSVGLLKAEVDEQDRRQAALLAQLEGALGARAAPTPADGAASAKPMAAGLRDLDALPSSCRSDEQMQSKTYPRIPCAPLSPSDAHAAVERERAARPYTAAPLSAGTATGSEIRFLEQEAARNQRAAVRQGLGPLSSASCAAMLSDDEHLFHAMWGAVAMRKAPPACLPNHTAATALWVRDMLAGRMCARNWQEGNSGCAGQLVQPPSATPGAAIIGVHDAVARYCNKRIGCAGVHRVPLAVACSLANLRASTLAGAEPQPSMCRTLEWLACAARGLLPGQAGSDLLIVSAPRDVDLRQLAANAPGFLYTPRDAYALQLCLLAQMCTNRAALFAANRTRAFNCDFDGAWLRRAIFSLRRVDASAADGLAVG